MSRVQTVLVVDDDIRITEWMQRLVRPLNVNLVTCSTGAEALVHARTKTLDVILLDVNLPDMSGYQICQQLRTDPAHRDLPIIFLTAAEDLEAKVRAFECGATDYVTKPFDIRELRARVRSALKTQALLEELATQAHTDALTGLPNRKGFLREVNRQIERGVKEPARTFSLIFIDLDQFKIVNDSLGHEVGDELLIHVASSLKNLLSLPEISSLSAEAVAGRMGGDEFAVLLPDLCDVDTAQRISSRILNVLSRPTLLRGYTLRAAASLGIRMCGGSELVLHDLFRDADVAMYQAKAAGRGRYAVFDQTMHQQALDRLGMENDLRQAIEREELQLYYQPIVDLESGRIEAFEALIRWFHPQHGPVSPSVFIPLAEESEMIVDIGNFVLRTAARFARQLADLRQNPPRICVNISKRQLANPDFSQIVWSVIESNGISPSSLELEITETAIMYDPEVIVPVLGDMREKGIRFAIDDFGTGYSSLSTLPQFPVSTLKIDRSFIKQLGHGRGETAIVNAVVSLSAHLGMTVVAEGVETLDQLFQLQSIGCALGQGYLLGKPMSQVEAQSIPENIDLVFPTALENAA